MPRPTLSPDAAPASPEWDELVRWISPRRVVRVDPHRLHRYADADVHAVVDGEPQDMPYALHLTTSQHRYKIVVFDLDTSRTPEGVAQVWRDADTLLQHLDQVGLEHVVARSGPGDGIHVWVPVSEEEGLEPADVARLARAAVPHLPSLDSGMLHNPVTGAVRPPGAPHRDGGRAELLHPSAPEDALTVFDTDTNTTDRFAALAEAFGPADEDDSAAADDDVEARIDRTAMRLRGSRSPMPDMVRHLLDTAPEADASAHLARILPRLALARWSLADVRVLVAAEPDAPGLEHLRSRRFGHGRRPRQDTDRDAVLTRQWTKAVEFAAGASPVWDRTERDLTGLRTLATQILDAAAEAQWWGRQAGQADALTLLAVLHVALQSGQDEVDVDIRRLALAAGFGKSTTARALSRLCADGRLLQTAAAEGTHAARYRLVYPSAWPGQILSMAGGTQGIPPHGGHHPPQTLLPTREDLLCRVHTRLEIASHDVWAEHSPTHPRGLGRHVEATYATLTDQSSQLDTVDLKALAARTGYSTATTTRHLRILVEHDLIEARTLAPTTLAPSAMDAAAARLGTAGVRAERGRRYEAERAAHAAWHAELSRLRSPVVLRRRVRPADRYARTVDGAPDHAAQLARHLASAA